MAPQIRSTKKKGGSGFVLGRAGFAKISAVEGIRLTSAMKKRAEMADRDGLTAKESLELIIQAYRKG